MKILIVEDDFVIRMVINGFLKTFGELTEAENGREAVEYVKWSLENDDPYDLICLDIMMPEMDGQEALKQIRALEAAHGVYSSDGAKVLMMTALDDIKNIMGAFESLCDGYVVKPVRKEKLYKEIEKLGFVVPQSKS